MWKMKLDSIDGSRRRNLSLFCFREREKKRECVCETHRDVCVCVWRVNGTVDKDDAFVM